MEIRKVKREEFDQCLRISEYAFQYTLPENERETRMRDMEMYEIWGEFENSSLISKVNVIPFQTNIANKMFSMGGIAGVATYPEKRRNGSVTRLLLAALKEMRQSGQIISFLHPFNIGFYRKFGWENASEFKMITLEKHDLKPIYDLHPNQGRMVRFNRKESIPYLREVYDQIKIRYNGLLERTDEWWEKRVHPQALYTAVYFNQDNQAYGYVLYSIKESECQIKEFMFINEEARTKLWNFVCQHDSMVKKVQIWTFLDDPIDVFLPVAKTAEVKPYGMVRIVDVHEFLKSYPFQGQLEGLTLLVDDPFCEWNTGAYTFTKDSVTYRPLDSVQIQQEKGVWLEIGTLSAVMVNYRTPTFFRRHGKIKGSLEETKRLEAALPENPAAVIDFF
ncbi:predicted acetyltransferase [Bacillus oleivorans]|uniref:Predicted acetyltransferase n=1 Tax=Bacillus oleivorans TaxID=1448271 RepID=A0A285CH14_9BACI|nr:GNAT family N-acetyltransferase [Bacillus oleivorans]SNX66881.1 predicted acetyltransferase [Bacillus oleivorans]